MRSIFAPLLLALLMFGCGLPEKTVAIENSDETGKVAHELLAGPDARIKIVLKGSGAPLGLMEKKKGQVTVTVGDKTLTEPVEKVKKDLGEREMVGCKSNLKNLGTACEMWSTDNQGRYPARPEQLLPNYLRRIPTCPVAGKDTYSEGYRSATGPDAYSWVCQGNHHAWAGVPDDYPRYNSAQGLISSP